MNSTALKMRQLRYARKANNLCIYCGEPRVTETMCEYHASKKRSSNEELRFRNKKRYPVMRRPKVHD